MLVSAVLKLTRVTKFAEGTRVYRGTGGRMALPLRFSQADEHGCKGFAEWGFMSTTTKQAVAIQYSGVREGRALPTVLEMEVTSVDRGASIAFFSQYPGEEEVLFPPMTFLAPSGAGQTKVEAGAVVCFVTARLNINHGMCTTEELLGRKKRGHLATFRFIVGDLGSTLRGIAADKRAEERLARDSLRVFNGVTHTVEGLVQRILGLVEEVRASQEETPTERFTDDAVYKGLVTEMLDAGTMAVSVLRLYLEDESRGIYFVMEMSLQDAHRALIAFRARAMAALEEGEARRAAALGLCQLKGLVVERIDEPSRAGETPLVRAAADGTVGPAALALLLAAGASLADGKALGAAAEHGQLEAVAALIGAKALVDSVAVEVGSLLFHLSSLMSLIPGPAPRPASAPPTLTSLTTLGHSSCSWSRC